MKHNQGQLKWIEGMLQFQGYITRNQCLKHYITRLGAYIYTLRRRGYCIAGEYVETASGRDFIYKLIK